MRRQGFTSLAAAAAATAAVLAGLPTATSEPMQLLGYEEVPDTYDFEVGLISGDGAYVWMGADIIEPYITKYMTNPSGLSPTCTLSSVVAVHFACVRGEGGFTTSRNLFTGVCAHTPSHRPRHAEASSGGGQHPLDALLGRVREIRAGRVSAPKHHPGSPLGFFSPFVHILTPSLTSIHQAPMANGRRPGRS